jgi:hypothetical protein
MPGATATPQLLTDAGFTYWAPLASTLPTNTVTGSVFTDAWPVAWLSMGATDDGSEFTYEIKVEPVKSAEFFDPIKYFTTDRSGSFALSMQNFALTNYKYALNGGAYTIVSGTTTTQLTSLTPPVPGAEVRAMIGWESLDHTMRAVMFQTISSGSIKSKFAKAPNTAMIPAEFNFEIPVSPTYPWIFWVAGQARI